MPQSVFCWILTPVNQYIDDIQLVYCPAFHPPPSPQDHCVPIHCLRAGAGHHGRQCNPWHHRWKQGRHPWQYGLTHVSWTHQKTSTRSNDTQGGQHVFTVCFPPQSFVHDRLTPHRFGDRRHQTLCGCLWRGPV